MKKNSYLTQWLIVAIAGLSLGLVLALFYQSDIVRLFKQPAINAFVNGVPSADTAQLGQNFMPHLKQQITTACGLSKDSSLCASFANLAQNKSIGAALYGLVEQCNISNLVVHNNGNHTIVQLTIATSKPFPVTYYFTTQNHQTIADSVSGIDHLLLYLRHSF